MRTRLEATGKFKCESAEFNGPHCRTQCSGCRSGVAVRRPKKFDIKQIKFALCNPKGVAVFVAGKADRCIGEYVIMHKSILLSATDHERWFDTLTSKGWTIRRCKVTAELANKPWKLPKHEVQGPCMLCPVPNDCKEAKRCYYARKTKK